jgi:hypothetical protein
VLTATELRSNKIAVKGVILFFVDIFAIQLGPTAVLRDFCFAGMSVSVLISLTYAIA